MVGPLGVQSRFKFYEYLHLLQQVSYVVQTNTVHAAFLLSFQIKSVGYENMLRSGINMLECFASLFKNIFY